MKRFILICFIIVAGMFLYAFQNRTQTSIVGRINPVSGANTAWAVSGKILRHPIL